MTLRNLLAILIIGTSFQLPGQSNGNDTTFIFKDTVDGELQTIFIDNNRESKFYDDISRFTFQQFDNDSYKISTDYFRENKLVLTKMKNVIPWTNWVTLKQYRDSFYVYYPCDFLYHFRQSINDTTFIDWTGEGPVANKITEQKKTGNQTYQIDLTGIYDKDRRLVIHIINLKKGIAVFEEITNGKNNGYYLMIAADKIKSVPIIVNYCPTQKQTELKFEMTDFKKLLITK
ncbi:MAG: hypothetical protein JWO44_1691 [Bacteroidetes bacterium]|nr:hypothetical protein [Bacteroidota bacterium]